MKDVPPVMRVHDAVARGYLVPGTGTCAESTITSYYMTKTLMTNELKKKNVLFIYLRDQSPAHAYCTIDPIFLAEDRYRLCSRLKL